MAIPTVEAIMIMPMMRMIGFGVMKKKTTEPPMPSIGRSCISAPSCWPRGSSGGGCNCTCSTGTSVGRARGGRLTTIWLTAHQFPCRTEVFLSAPPWRRAPSAGRILLA
ncbi:hypothetical protein ACZ90_05515 [Streptomyces albus subsp. albus]|nr:hypothetical protein ACZ90_05515 [Streptomyces albus subsp. albus]